MDDARVGRALRAIRHHLAWRQDDVAARARVSQASVSVAERGHIDAMPLGRIRRIARAVDADIVVTVRWRAGDLDRLLDEGHASLIGLVAGLLEALGWEAQPEVTYSIYGERGSIDLLAWHAPTRTLLVIEVKTELTSIEETLRRHDTKVRLGAQIAAERFDWRAANVSRLVVLPNAATPRRRVQRHAAVLDRAYPARAAAVRRWLAAPTGVLDGLLFVSPNRGTSDRRRRLARKRIRPPRSRRSSVSQSSGD
jgi:transcriptional regulator with XRE-family HTH domain